MERSSSEDPRKGKLQWLVHPSTVKVTTNKKKKLSTWQKKNTVVTKTTDGDSLRYTYNETRRVRQLALGCESN